MPRRLRELWREFRRAEPGQRFRARFRRRAAERAAGSSQWSRIILIAIALLSIVVAIPLMILPGPATLFYLLAGFLLAGESSWVAALLDHGELLARRLGRRLRRKASTKSA